MPQRKRSTGGALTWRINMRIRSIKPRFFSNELLADLPPHTRLLFVGLWCVADRAGRLEDRPRRLRAEIFPYEDVDVEPMLADLARAGFIVRYRVGDQYLISIPSWGAHQFPRPDEKPSALPPYEPGSETKPSAAATYSAVADPSLCSDGRATPQQMGSGVRDLGDGNRDLGCGDRASRVAPAAPPSTEPPSTEPPKLVELWNGATSPPIPRCLQLTDKRRQKALARLKKRPLAEWRAVFERIQASAFCRGETDRGTWRADFDWVIRDDTVAARVLEGKYDDRAGPTLISQRSAGNREAMRVAAEGIQRAG